MSSGTGNPFTAIGRFFHKCMIILGFAIDDMGNNDMMNEATVQAEIGKAKQKASQAQSENGKLAGNIAMVKAQIADQKREEEKLVALVKIAINENDVTNGSSYAENLANLKTDIANNQQQLESMTNWYKNNVEIIAESLRQVQKFQRDFDQLKIRVKIGRSQQALAEMLKASTTELQGMVGGEAAEAMQRMRETAFAGEGQMTATIDLANKMGSSIKQEQIARQARGRALFEEMAAAAKSKSPNVGEQAIQVIAAVKAEEKPQVVQVQS